MSRTPSLPALAQGAEELRRAADPVPVADRLLVAAMAACRDLRAAQTKTREQDQTGKGD